MHQRSKALPKIDDTAWMPKTLEILRDINASITISSLKALNSDLTDEEAERRLRALTSKGWLRMGKETDEEGKFIRYIWTIR